jgi:hypothetical protein
MDELAAAAGVGRSRFVCVISRSARVAVLEEVASPAGTLGRATQTDRTTGGRGAAFVHYINAGAHVGLVVVRVDRASGRSGRAGVRRAMRPDREPRRGAKQIERVVRAGRAAGEVRFDRQAVASSTGRRIRSCGSATCRMRSRSA